jgi:hypothetical protein
MALKDERLAEFIDALETTGRRYLTLGMATAFRLTNTADGAPKGEMAATAAAEAAWKAAEKALADYRAARH